MIQTRLNSVFYKIIPLSSLFAKEASKLTFLFYLRHKPLEIGYLVAIWMILSIIFSPIISLISDISCRRNTLIFVLISSLSAIILISYGHFYSAIIIDGIFGAVTPIARAAYCDLHISDSTLKKKTGILAETIMVQALAWIVLCSSYIIFDKHLLSATFLAITISLLGTMFIFKDLRDKDKILKIHDILRTLKKHLHGYALRLLFALFLFDLAFQLANYFAENVKTERELQLIFLIVEGVGIFIGSLAVRMWQIVPNYRSILISSCGLFLVFFFTWILNLVGKHQVVSLSVLLTFSSIGGIVLSLIFGYFANKAKVHEEGVLFGIIESIGIFAEAIISLLIYGVLIYLKMEIHQLKAFPFLSFIGMGILFLIKRDVIKNRS